MVDTTTNREDDMESKGGLRYPDGIYPKPCPCGKSDCWVYRPKGGVKGG